MSSFHIPTMAEMTASGQTPDVLFWVGCAGSFDDRAKRITKAIARILHASETSFAVLGQEESCTGDPAKRAGNEFLYQMQAAQNIATLNGYGIKRIITGCPHCFNALKNEYPELGGTYEVLHHTQFIRELIETGKLRMSGDTPFKGRRITFHDPCYLGRIGGELDAPRDAIGGVDVEAERHGRDSFCCGAGGAQMWMEEHVDEGYDRVNVIRSKELAATGADTVAVGCPFCSTMVTDGLSAIGAEMEVKDVAELVWEQIKANDAKIEAAKVSAEPAAEPAEA